VILNRWLLSTVIPLEQSKIQIKPHLDNFDLGAKYIDFIRCINNLYNVISALVNI